MSELLLSKDDAVLCGMGRGAACCAYLLMGAKGFECGRVTSLAETIKARTPLMNAKRLPIGLFPECQTEGIA